MLEIKHLTKRYASSKVKAIDDVNITIENGDIYGFVGPNGAGKSTTIKSVVGIHNYEGEIIFEGESIKKDPIATKAQIAYIPDNPDLYEHLTGMAYINFVCDIYGVGKEREERISKYAAMFSITDDLSRPIKTYSHGMKQKTALIAALAHKPKLLVLDEPFVGLDPKAAYDLKEVMKQFCADGGMIFFSSHVLEVVEKLCNKIAIIKKGKIIASGNTEEVRGNKSLEETFLGLFE